MTLGDRIAVMKKGVLQQCADPFTLYTRPANQFVAGFIGSPPINFFTAKVSADGGSIESAGITLPLDTAARAALSGRAGQAVLAGIRPEDLHLSSQGGGSFGAKVEVREPLGNETLVHWTSALGALVTRVPGQESPAVGSDAQLHYAFAKLHLFDAATEQALLAEPATV